MIFSSCSVALVHRHCQFGCPTLLEIDGTRIQSFVIGSVAIFCMHGGAPMEIQWY